MIGKRLIKKYLKYCLDVRGCAVRTVDGYSYDLQTYMNFLKSKGKKDAGFDDILDFIVYLRNCRFNESNAINRKMTTLKGFYGYLVMRELIPKNQNPVRNLPKIKPSRKKLPVVLSENEIKKIMKVIQVNTELGYRDYAIITTLYVTGIRISELCGIKIKDIDFFNQSITVLGKGNRERIVPMNKHLIKVLKKYLGIRGSECHSENLFRSKRGNGITRGGIYRRLREYGERAGLSKSVSPHKFRHSCATHLLKKGTKIEVVSELLGHRNISSTQIYIHVNIDELLAAAKTHPIFKIAPNIKLESYKLPYQGRYKTSCAYI